MGGVYVNGERVDVDFGGGWKSWVMGDRYMVVRIGKKNYYLFEFEE